MGNLIAFRLFNGQKNISIVSIKNVDMYAAKLSAKLGAHAHIWVSFIGHGSEDYYLSI